MYVVWESVGVGGMTDDGCHMTVVTSLLPDSVGHSWFSSDRDQSGTNWGLVLDAGEG